MLKDILRTACQKLIGFDNYLFIFSLFNILRMQTGGYEKEFFFFMKMLPRKGTILDIGANIGVMTVALAKKYPEATICSFEPMPENIRALKRVIRFYKLKNIQVFPVALGQNNERVKMIMPFLKHSKMQGLSHVVEPGETIQQGKLFSIPMQRMDDITALGAQHRITAIKMDVENFEYYVLKGGAALLKTHRPLIYCELWDNERRVQCFDFIKSLGYQVKVYRQGGLVAFTGQQAINFFFLP